MGREINKQNQAKQSLIRESNNSFDLVLSVVLKMNIYK